MTQHAILAGRTSGAIGEALNAMAGYGSEFERTFANHAPMAMTALAGLGASPERLQSFFAYYSDYKHLPRFSEPGTALTAETWAQAIGRREREPDLRAFFLSQVAERGAAETIRAHLPRLAPGVPASAFHGLMRLAYALMSGRDPDVGIALGYWAATFLMLRPATGAPPVTDDPAAVLARAMTIPSLRDLKLNELLWQNMRDAAAQPAFAGVADWLAIDDGTLKKMAATGLAVFAATQHFAALHIVTGVHWLRVVEPTVDRPTFFALLRYFWAGIAGLVGELGFPTLPDPATLSRWRAIETPDWSALQSIASESFDEHDISLAFSAREEFEVYGDPLYRVALARRLGLIADYRS